MSKAMEDGRYGGPPYDAADIYGHGRSFRDQRLRQSATANLETLRDLTSVREEEIGERQFAKPPRIISWVPPHGAVVMCPSLEGAQQAASRFAGDHPGSVVAIYQLVGFAFTAPKPAEFTPVEPIVPAADGVDEQ